MRGKKLSALLMAATMIVGSMGIVSPVQAAEETETPRNMYTMTVPEKLAISSYGWNKLGEISLKGNVDTTRTVTVTATTENNFHLKQTDGTDSVEYKMKRAESDTEATNSFDFNGTDIGNGSAKQTIGVDVENFDGKAAGTYDDTITFTAQMQDEVIQKTAKDIPTCQKLEISLEWKGEDYTFELESAEVEGYHAYRVKNADNYPFGSGFEGYYVEENEVFGFSLDEESGILLYIDTNQYMQDDLTLKSIKVDGVDIFNQLKLQKTAKDILTCEKLEIGFEYKNNEYNYELEPTNKQGWGAFQVKNNSYSQFNVRVYCGESKGVNMFVFELYEGNKDVNEDSADGEIFLEIEGNNCMQTNLTLKSIKVDGEEIINQLEVDNDVR